MDTETLKIIANVTFVVIIILMAIVSLMTMYVFIRYGRSRSFAMLTSIVFAGVFVLGVLAAFVTMQNIF